MKAQAPNLWLCLSVVAILFLYITPLPAFLVDWLLVLNFTFSLMLLFVALNVEKPASFSAFPVLLLLATLYRLGLNLSTTRLILSSSPEGGSRAAGEVVYTFGEFMTHGSLLLGFILFLLILVVHYFVITKGADRISEVIARFTLDGLPGRQLSIDRELARGSLSAEAARAEKAALSQESHFFASMDGVMKFLQGDALASLLITGVNLLGGLVVGLTVHRISLAQALTTFGKLTVGDGLVSLLPGFLNALAAGIVIARVGGMDLPGREISRQLFSDPMPLSASGVTLLLLCITPLPTLPLLCVGGGLLFLAYLQYESSRPKRVQEEREQVKASIVELTQPETVEILLGFRLIRLAQESKGGQLGRWVMETRRKLAEELGFLLPPVSISDSMQVSAKGYAIRIQGSLVAKGTLQPEKLLAVNPGGMPPLERGKPTREPAFGLEAYWIEPQEKERAESLGYQILSPVVVLATHFREVVLQNMEKILSRREVIRMLEQARNRIPDLVQAVLVREEISLSELKSIFQELLREQIPLLDLETILETSLELRDLTPMAVAEELRLRLVPRVIEKLLSPQGKLTVLKLGASLGQTLQRGHLKSEEELALAQHLAQQVRQRGGHPVVCARSIRRYVSQLLRLAGWAGHVFSDREVTGYELNVVGEIHLAETPVKKAG